MRAGFALFLLVVIPSISATAGTVTVNALTDDGAGNCAAKCTLRDAILSASPADTIVFSSSLSYPATIVLSGTELYVFRDVTIVGPGIDALAISGNQQSRIMNVAVSASANISGLTLRDGFAADGQEGGAFVVNAGSSLVLTRVLLTANRAVNVNEGGSAEGGAIYAEGDVRISDSILSDNHAIGGRGGDLIVCPSIDLGSAGPGGYASGGAISAGAGLVLSNVVLANNSATGGMGGDAPDGSACHAGPGGHALGGALGYQPRGGIASTAGGYVGFVTAVNNAVTPGGSGSTGASNVAGMALGAAIYVEKHIFVHNSVLTTDDATKACDGYPSGLLYAWGGNLDNDSSCTGFNLHSDPQLQVTTAFGQQLKVFPLFGSPLIDAATDCLDAEGYVLDHDVLGTPRPQDGNLDLSSQCDVGAVEYTDSIFSNGFE